MTSPLVTHYVEAIRVLHTARAARGPLPWVEESQYHEQLDAIWSEMTPQQRDEAERTIKVLK